MELRIGFDYHLAEAVRRPDGTWRASCNACGWFGPMRGSDKRAAEDDAAAHDVTENEGGR